MSHKSFHVLGHIHYIHMDVRFHNKAPPTCDDNNTDENDNYNDDDDNNNDIRISSLV